MSGHPECTSSSPLRYASSSPSPCDVQEITTPPSSPITQTPSKDKPDTSAVVRTKKTANAFSILGKRKTPLTTGDGNARPQKRIAIQCASTTRSPSLTQMQLSLGQKVEKRCKECGMVYVTSSEEDRKLHDTYHKRLLVGYTVGPQLASKATVVPHMKDGAKAREGETICVIASRDPPWKRKHAREVLDIITTSLGAVEIPDSELWASNSKEKGKDDDGQYEMWLYLCGEVCAAALLIERRKQARRVLDRVRMSTKGLTASERLRQRREEASQNLNAPLEVSAEESHCTIGISRIWTAPAFRKRGYAISLLDTMFEQKCSKSSSRMDEVAFSQPTSAGTGLARRWFGRQSGWLVY